MSIFGYIAKGFSIAKASSPLFLSIFGFSFVWTLINLPFTSADGAAEPSAIAAVLGVAFMLISIFIQSGSIGYIEQVVKQGNSNMGVFVQQGTKNYLRMLGLGIVLGLMMIILVVIAVIGFVAGGSQTGANPVAVVLAVLMAIIGLILLLFLFMAPYAVVVDGKGVIGALKTSVNLVKKNLGVVLGVGLILVVIGFAIGFLLGLLMGALTGILPGKAGIILGGFLSSAVNAFIGIVTTGAFMALYLNHNSGESASGAGSAAH